MFCYKCGKEINENQKYCAYCGCEIGSENDAKNTGNKKNLDEYSTNNKSLKNKVRNKKITIWVSFILVVLIGVISCIAIGVQNDSFTSKVPNTIPVNSKQVKTDTSKVDASETNETTSIAEEYILPETYDSFIFANNMENASFATYDGKYIYYLEDISDGVFSETLIHRIQLPDGESKKIASTSFVPEAMYVEKDTIHYEHAFSSGTINCKTGKSKETDEELFNNANTLYYNDMCFYFCSEESETGIYIGEQYGKGEKVSDVVVARAYPCGDHIYLFSSYTSVNGIDNPNQGTWKMNLDGSELTKILDYCPEYFVSDGKNLYFKDQDDCLVISDLNASNQDVTSIQIGDGLNIKDGVIYFEDYDETGIYSMVDSPICDLVVAGDVTGIVLADDHIVYYSEEKIWVATIDGLSVNAISYIGDYSDHRF